MKDKVSGDDIEATNLNRMKIMVLNIVQICYETKREMAQTSNTEQLSKFRNSGNKCKWRIQRTKRYHLPV